MTNKKSYSATELAKMKLPHLPTTKKGWLDLVKREDWISVMVPGGRGCKGGLKREYYPSKAVAVLIESAQKADQATSTSNHYPTSTATHLITGTENHARLTAHSHSGNQIRVNNFVTVPKNSLQTVNPEGQNQTIHSEQIVDYLAFNKEWLDMSMDVRNNCLALITVKDDSMEPTLKTNDLILTDVRRGKLESNSIYVLQIKNELIVKRIQCKINGNVIVKSDNPNYEPEELDELAAQSLHVVGKVIWYGRRI
jgi:phage repressor protein C with HTH and peptisase S24 domain